VLDSFVLDEIKTKNFVEAIDKLNKKNVLIVISEKNENLELSSNNVPYVKVLKCEGLNVYDILKYDSLILIKEAVEPIERRLLG
jgi:large subunit ribosomal protein L4